MAKKQRCYIYTRVSTELQIDGYSLEAQKERLRSEAKHRKMQVCGEYSDEGKSGKNIAGRPEFKKMLSDIKSGKDDIDYVLVFKLSRFGRNAADTLNSLQFMEDYGVNLLCVEDGIDSAGAAGKLIISVLASVAEIERSNISEQTMAGRQQKARDGLWNGGFAPYGYKLVSVEGQKSKMLVINEDEAELIKLIYEKYLSGMGVNAVAKWLNDNGYRKTVRQNGTVPLISDHFVKGVLDNPVYAGKIAYGRRRNEKVAGTRNEFHVVKQDKDSYKLYPGKHEPIIDEETWYKVQVKRMKNAFKREKTHSLLHEHVLSGIIKCPVCGAPMYGVVNRKKKKGSEEFYTDMWYYICKNRKMVSGHPCDYKKHIRQDEINVEVIQMIKYVFGGENSMKDNALSKVGTDDSLKELEAEKTRLADERAKLNTKKAKQLRRINELDIDDDLYDDLMKSYRAYLGEINDQLASIENLLYQNELAIENAQGENLSTEVYKRLIDATIENIDDVSDADKKVLMNALLEKVEIFKEKQKDGRWVKSVQFKIPLNIDGKLVDTMFFDDDEDTENSLSNEKHVETVVLLSHKKPDGHINVKVEFGEGEGKVPLDNIAKRAEEYKPKERVTYKMIKEYIEAKYGFKVHTAYIAEVKRDLGLPMYDAPNAVEELKQPRKHPTPEKVEAIKDALRYFAVI